MPQTRISCEALLRGSDIHVLVTLPTDSGKSPCYSLLPKAFDCLRKATDSVSWTPCIVMVVSPLIVFMQDQVRAMSERNVSAVYAGRTDQLVTDIGLGKYQLVYFGPKSILTDSRWRDVLRSPTYCERLIGLILG